MSAVAKTCPTSAIESLPFDPHKDVAYIFQAKDDDRGALNQINIASLQTIQIHFNLKLVLCDSFEDVAAQIQAEKNKIKLVWFRMHANQTSTRFGKKENFVSYLAFTSKYRHIFDKLDASARFILEGCLMAKATHFDNWLTRKTEKLPTDELYPYGTSAKSRKIRYNNEVDFRAEGYGIRVEEARTGTFIAKVPSLSLLHAISFLAQDKIVCASEREISPDELLIKACSTHIYRVVVGNPLSTHTYLHAPDLLNLKLGLSGLKFEVRLQEQEESQSIVEHHIVYWNHKNPPNFSLTQFIELRRKRDLFCFIKTDPVLGTPKF